MNNSITNSALLTHDERAVAVKMMNNLSAELDVLRASMLETGLNTVLHNLNRKNGNLRLFEFGKTYRTKGAGQYDEQQHLALFLTGKSREENWHVKKENADIYFLKGAAEGLLRQLGLNTISFTVEQHAKLDQHLQLSFGKTPLGSVGRVKQSVAETFGIKQEVYVLDLLWDNCLAAAEKQKLRYKEIPKYPAVQRDLAFVVNNSLSYAEVEGAVNRVRIGRLANMKLFDVFESEKLGVGKKSMAMSFTFQDEEKTLTDKDIDDMMQKIIVTFEKELNAEIRKS
jgi:phenylalanyl-tRNA synthetase beta chain